MWTRQATALAISESTVRIYCSALFRKLGIKDRYELAIYGMKNMSHRQHQLTDGLETRAATPETEAPAPQVSNLIEALQASLEQAKKAGGGAKAKPGKLVAPSVGVSEAKESKKRKKA